MKTPRTLVSLLFAVVVCGIVGPLAAQDVVKRKKKVVLDLKWSVRETKHFVIQYDSAIPSVFVSRVSNELEDILKQYVKLFGSKPKKGERFAVRFLDNRNTFIQVTGEAARAGLYKPWETESVPNTHKYTGTLYLLRGPFLNLVPTTYHEAFHQYIHFYVGPDVRIPTWFNEGTASYFEGMQRDTRTRAKSLNPKLIDNRKIRQVKDAILTRTHIPLEKLIDAPYEEFHDRNESGKESLHYNESFSVIYYFMKATRGRAVADYMRTLKKTKDVEAANAKLFGKERKNLKKVEKLWKLFTYKLDTDKTVR